jgi:uncharacterized protein (DUF302 family)
VSSNRLIAIATASLIALGGTVLAQESKMEPNVTRRMLQVEHIMIETPKKFGDVEATLERIVPQLDPAMLKALAEGDEGTIAKFERDSKLFIFLKRDHGAILKIAGAPRKVIQYEIGNAHTATKMTRHKLGAALYAPLRLVMYENAAGGTTFEYDKPSSLFAQYDDEKVAAVGRDLDEELEEVLRKAAE